MVSFGFRNQFDTHPSVPSPSIFTCPGISKMSVHNCIYMGSIVRSWSIYCLPWFALTDIEYLIIVFFIFHWTLKFTAICHVWAIVIPYIPTFASFFLFLVPLLWRGAGIYDRSRAGRLSWSFARCWGAAVPVHHSLWMPQLSCLCRKIYWARFMNTWLKRMATLSQSTSRLTIRIWPTFVRCRLYWLGGQNASSG